MDSSWVGDARLKTFGPGPGLDPTIQALIDIGSRKAVINEYTNREVGLELFIRRVCAWTCVGTVIAALGTAATAPLFLALLSEGRMDRGGQVVLYFSIGLVGMFVMRKVVLLDVPVVHRNEYDGLEVTNNLSRCFFWASYFFFMGVCVVPPGIVVGLHDIRVMAVLQVLNLVVQLSFIAFSMAPKYSEFFLLWGLPLLCGVIGFVVLGVFMLFTGLQAIDQYPLYLYATYGGGVLMFMVVLAAYVRHCCNEYERDEPDHLYMCMTFWSSPLFVLLSYLSALARCVAFFTRSRIYRKAQLVEELRRRESSLTK